MKGKGDSNPLNPREVTLARGEELATMTMTVCMNPHVYEPPQSEVAISDQSTDSCYLEN